MQQHAVEFRGEAGEYFRIWIVNLVLSIITLGIYSAWATVRTRRYFMGNTIIDGSSFDYHASPRAILKGRLIAILVLLLYTFGDVIHIMVIPIVALLIAILFPWLYRVALRFRRRMTSYRNVRFDFTGSTVDSYGAWAPGYLFFIMFMLVLAIPFVHEETVKSIMIFYVLGMFASLFVFPWLHYLISRYSVANTRFGNQAFTTGFDAGDFGGLFLRVMGLSFGIGLVLFIIAFLTTYIVGLGMLGSDGQQDSSIGFWLYLASMYMMMALAFTASQAYWAAGKRNIIANQTRLGSLHMHSNMEFWDYWTLLLGNLFAIVFTLGMAYPWARIKVARYHAETLVLEGNIDEFISEHDTDSAAFGEEIADALELDIGF